MERSSFITSGLTTTGLVLAILVTRVEHFGTASTPPDATLAALFLAGLWVPRAWAFAVLLGAAAVADQLAFRHGTSDWCVTAAYLFLIPTYACLWWAGYASRGTAWTRPAGLARGAGNLLSSLAAAFVISSGSFLLLSGYFPGMSGLEYWLAVAHHFLPYAGWPAAYVCAALTVSEAVRARRRAGTSLPPLLRADP
jgi:hypothetical protein